jgi:hypothetical protein
LCIDRTEQGCDQRFAHPVNEPRCYHAPRTADAAQNRDREGLDPNRVPIVEVKVNNGAMRIPAMLASKPEIIKDAVTTCDFDSHESRGSRILDNSEERLSAQRSVKKQLQRQGDGQPGKRDQQLQKLNLYSRNRQRTGCQNACGHTAWVLTERK